MPCKRRTFVKIKQSDIRRLLCPHSAPPHVVVESSSGVEVKLSLEPVNDKAKEAMMNPKPVQQKLAAPEYNTCVRQKSEIDILKKKQASVAISPKSMAAIAPKITQKLNFQPGETVFKNLKSLNVNDSVVMPQKMSSRPVNNSKARQPEIQLADYLENIRPIDIAVPEPELELDFDREPFNFYSNYRQIYYS